MIVELTDAEVSTLSLILRHTEKHQGTVLYDIEAQWPAVVSMSRKLLGHIEATPHKSVSLDRVEGVMSLADLYAGAIESNCAEWIKTRHDDLKLRLTETFAELDRLRAAHTWTNAEDRIPEPGEGPGPFLVERAIGLNIYYHKVEPVGIWDGFEQWGYNRKIPLFPITGTRWARLPEEPK